MKDRLTHSKNTLLVLAIFSLGIMGFAMQNAFADPPEFTAFVADDPDNADTVYSNGDTLTITFDQATNATGGGAISQGEINANFTFASPAGIGTTYSGVWAADSTSLTITVTDVGAAVLVVGTTTVDGAGTTTISDAGGANADLISLNAGGPLALTGDFGVLAAGSKCDRDCTPPTMGPGTNGELIVEDGFSYNGHAVNVAKWHTEYPLIVVQTGKMNVLEAKFLDDWDSNIRSVRIAFGVPEIGKLYQGETIVEYYPNEIIGSQLNVIDKKNLLDKVSITTEKTNCNSGEFSPTCTLLRMEHMFREAPLANVVGISLADQTRNGVQFYFNDGIGVDGESLNPPQTATISLANKKDATQIQLTQIDRGENLWVDEQENVWFQNSFGSWIKITRDDGVVITSKPIAQNGIDRNHPAFNTYKSGQELLATQIWNSGEIQSILPDSFAVEFDGINRMEDPQLQKTILKEIQKAQQIYEQKFNK